MVSQISDLNHTLSGYLRWGQICKLFQFLIRSSEPIKHHPELLISNRHIQTINRDSSDKIDPTLVPIQPVPGSLTHHNGKLVINKNNISTYLHKIPWFQFGIWF